MASIIKIAKHSKQLPIILNNPVFINSLRTVGFVQAWKPGPFPKTKEERIQAAKKYNLHPDEYVPHLEEDPMGFYKGDYPELPKIGFSAKDPYYPYDMPETRRNVNEPLHEDFEMLGGDRCDKIGLRERVSDLQAACTFLGLMLVAYTLYYIGDHYKHFRPVLGKQYPEPGVKHYTFEPAD